MPDLPLDTLVIIGLVLASDRKNISEKARPRKGSAKAPTSQPSDSGADPRRSSQESFWGTDIVEEFEYEELVAVDDQANGSNAGRARSSSALFARANTDFFFAGNARGTNTCTEPGRRAGRNFWEEVLFARHSC